ncbi:MAG: PEP/pyruvate-binding domain-containing protein [Planctomycetota bacterium]|jgi:tetratricopeptide (TPR) repeat protein|nr:PEP/pyruvate-binding domain-containing protein [Planctomycetota bacterium]
MPTFERIRSGFPGLDVLVDHIRMGDNVVWQLDDLDQYRHFAVPNVEQALADGRRVNYVRFALHPPILEARPELAVRNFDPEAGFETFTTRVRELITAEGRDAFYVFDSLSELQTAWASDLMMGCFFRVTCPYLFDLNTVAYFAILRNRHSFDAVARIRDTTQLLLDVYGHGGDYYIQPLKVWNRYSPTMFSPHLLSRDGQSAKPLIDAVEATRFHGILNERGLAPMDGSLDHWDRTFLAARLALDSGGDDRETRRRLILMLAGRDSRICQLFLEHFSCLDLLRIKERMIGSGSVGGKTAGMLLARKIIENRLPELRERLEPHDSFYVGADVFYSFLVENGWWTLRIEQRTAAGFFSAAEELGGRIGSGHFPSATREQFRRMLDYFGQSPIIVRSSSLLEDGFGNAFAGKYASIFLVNSGALELRLAAFEDAVKRVYASSMDPSALVYRRQRDLADKDEQMAILVQRVSGSELGGFFMPTAAGVGHSHNVYVWNERIDPAAGMLRLVAGLGTRAVDRVESDYPRVLSLSAPDLMPVAGAEERARYSQRYLDALNLAEDRLETLPLDEAARHWPAWLRALLCERDHAAEASCRERGVNRDIYYCGCENLAGNESFIGDMRQILSTLQDAYDYPIDIEFAVNFSEAGGHVINLLQCRPLQIRGRGAALDIPEIPPERVFFDLPGSSLGGGVDWPIDYVILVDSGKYLDLDLSGKYGTARLIGRINRILADAGKKIMLIGPGRWGTRSPDLGVPVSFSEISGMAAMCEVPFPGDRVSPELSYGSHFFQDLLEAGIYYASIPDDREGYVYRAGFFDGEEDILAGTLGEAADAKTAVRLYDAGKLRLWLKSDAIGGRSLCGVFPDMA